MSRFNTGNPIGSDDPRDRSDNTKNLDLALNNQAQTWVDRFGVERPTVATAIDPSGMVQTAVNAKTAAEGARDSAFVNAEVYASVSAGLAAVANGEQFQVVSGDEILRYRRVDASTEELVARYPTVHGVESKVGVAVDISSTPASQSGEFYSGDESPTPLFVDETGAMLISLDDQGFLEQKIGGEFHGSASNEPDYAHVNEDGVLIFAFRDGEPLAPWGFDFYTDDNEATFFLVADDGSVLLSWGEDGALLQASDPIASADSPLIPYQDGDDVIGVDSEELLLANVEGLPIFGLSASKPKSARAAVEFPWANQKLTCSLGNGYIIPDNQRTVFGFVGIGQSLVVGSTSAASLVSVDPVYPDRVLMFDTGATSDVRMGIATSGDQVALDPDSLVGFTPLVAKVGQGSGARGETPMEAHANTLQWFAEEIDAQFTSLSFTAGQGGTLYANLKKGTQVYTNMLAAIEKAVELCAAQGKKFVLAGAVVKHGEGDASNPAYFDFLLEWQQDIDADAKAITNQSIDVHFFMTQPSSFYGSSEAARAMLKAHLESPYHHLAGADYPYLDEYSPDLVHMTGPGYFHIGEKIAEMWAKGLWTSKGKQEVVAINSATRSGQLVTAQLSVPVPPLVFDDSLFQTQNQGFRYEVDGDFVSVSSVQIADDGTNTGVAIVQLSLTSTPSGAERLHYATDGHSGTRQEENIPRGNVRDSSAFESSYDGRLMHNWGVHQIIDVELT